MQLILQIISLLCIYVLVAVFKYKTERNFDFNLDSPYIKLHKAYLVIGGSVSILACILSVWSFLQISKSLSFVLFVFALLSSLLVFAYFGFRIAFDDEKIIYRYFFENAKTIYYKDIIEIRHGLDLIIKTNSRQLVIPNYMTNMGALLLKMMLFLPKRKNVKEVPKVRSFFESVERPREFLIVFVGLEVVFSALFAWFLIASNFDSRVIIFAAICMSAISGLFFFCVHSAKRAHSSVFWNKVAKKLFKDGYLRD
ncbi:MAG: hypothetical protein E7666_04285 [Ruminococcaceae bacterium]|nr:hypothetical protein [Oscillospiraceae bacterium]